MGSARAVHRPHPGISPEQARDARARAWHFVFQCWQESQMAAKRAPTPNGSNERNQRVQQAKEAAMT
jgi:hypothetical protein